LKLIVAFPTLGRVEKATRCIQTIQEAAKECLEDDVFIRVVFSDHAEANTIGTLFGKDPSIICYKLYGEHVAPKLWNDLLITENYDCFCYLSDDIELDKDCLRRGLDCLIENFPDFDGMVGLKMKNCPPGQAVQAAFGILGKRFTERFLEKQVFCPEYKKFCIDKELEIFAKSVNRFVFCEEATLVHHHPAFTNTPKDKTHEFVRQHLPRDLDIFKKRREKKYLWGENFERLGAIG